MATKTVKAKKVREGDFLPALGNGYVFEDAEPAEARDIPGGWARDGYVIITFHDAEGEENYLIVADNLPVTVSRG